MRRNNRNPGRIGGGGSSLNSGGPFLSDHLKDIDLELDLLKRKREMLERQQHLIQPLMPQQRNFTQQPFYQLEPKEGGSNRDFSHLYNDGSQHRKPYGKKRQSDSDWQQNSYPPKRPSGQGQRSNYGNAGSPPIRSQRPYAGQSQQPKSSTPYNYGHNKQSIGQKIVNQRPPPQKHAKPFVANRVTKSSKVHAPPNKLAAQPVTERQKLVATAIQSVAEVVTRDQEALRLLPDKEPTKQMTGRLELALGAILKDIRDKCAETPHGELLRSTSLQRVIKQAIRERIRSAMLGKIVGAAPDTIKEYRAMYPKDTDIEIVNIALEAGGVKPETDPKPIEVAEKEKESKPEEFYRVKMIKLIDKHLHEMFDKVKEIYTKEAAAEEAATTEANNTDTIKGNQETSAEETVGAINDETVEPSSTAQGSTDPTSNDAAEGAGGATNTVAVNGASVTKPARATRVKNDEEIPEDRLPYADDYKRLMPRLLKRHIPTILKLLHINKMYKRAVFDINTATRSKLVEYGKPDELGNAVVDTSSEVAPIPKKFPVPYVVLPYYVKVMGKPQLPKKKVMHTFLDVFHPKSIKKHRTIHNLLFIGFSEKSDFEAIVEADGTTIGRSTLSIRVCDKTPGKTDDGNEASADQNTSQNDASQEDIKTDSLSDMIGTELDGQITDLLTTIDGDKANTSIDTDDQQLETADGQEEENPEEGAQDFANDENVGTVDNVDEVLENIEEQNYDDNTDQNGEYETVENNGVSEETPTADEQADQVTELTNTTAVKATPIRASARLSTPATPSSIRTRRSSRQIQN